MIWLDHLDGQVDYLLIQDAHFDFSSLFLRGRFVFGGLGLSSLGQRRRRFRRRRS